MRPPDQLWGRFVTCGGFVTRPLVRSASSVPSLAWTALLLLTAILPLQASDRYSDNWRVEDREHINRTFQVASGSGAKKLLVDNIDGFIHVTGYSGNEVRVSVERHTIAESKEALAEAKRDVKLDMSQQGNFVRLYADGPFRDHDRGYRYYNYRVRFDYEIQVPKDSELILHNLNHEIQVRGASGDFEVHGLNGPIDMDAVAGSGSVHTLNGKVKVAFTRNPERPCDFHTLNGTVDVYFQEPLNADLQFHTLNGGVWADFDPSPIGDQSNNGHLIYTSRRSNRTRSGRVGKGGPLLTFHGLNGAIRLHTKTQ